MASPTPFCRQEPRLWRGKSGHRAAPDRASIRHSTSTQVCQGRCRQQEEPIKVKNASKQETGQVQEGPSLTTVCLCAALQASGACVCARMSEASGLQVLLQPLPAHCHRNSPFARCSVQTPKHHYPQTPSQPARALESTRTAELAVLMKCCLTEKQAAPGSMYKTIGFMNMHKVLFLETIAAVVIGAEQAGGGRQLIPTSFCFTGSFWKVSITSCIPRIWSSARTKPTETIQISSCPWPHPTLVRVGNRAQRGEGDCLRSHSSSCRAKTSTTRPRGPPVAGPWEETDTDQTLSRSKPVAELSRRSEALQWKKAATGLGSGAAGRAGQRFHRGALRGLPFGPASALWCPAPSGCLQCLSMGRVRLTSTVTLR